MDYAIHFKGSPVNSSEPPSDQMEVISADRGQEAVVKLHERYKNIRVDVIHEAGIQVDLKSSTVKCAYNIQSGISTNAHFSNKDLSILSKDYFEATIKNLRRIRSNEKIKTKFVEKTNSETIKETSEKVLNNKGAFFVFKDSSLVMCPKSLIIDLLVQIQLFDENDAPVPPPGAFQKKTVKKWK